MSKICSNILWSMEKPVTALKSIDLSATFDTVDYDILLNVGNKCFRISGIAYQWHKHDL